jgi:hypothetical protein
MMIGVWVLLDSVRDGPVPVEPAVMAALVGTVYVMQPVIHVDAVLPRELRSGVTGVHVGTVDPVPVPGAATGRHTGADRMWQPAMPWAVCCTIVACQVGYGDPQGGTISQAAASTGVLLHGLACGH